MYREHQLLYRVNQYLRFANLLAIVLILLLGNGCATTTGGFSGDLVLYPADCQKTDARICKLGSELTYRSPRDNLVWQTDRWKDGNGESGTTDGASIPEWAQHIIGDAYDESYLKAAIVHDHYCYDENHVRTWRQTHRMFYDALIDLGVNQAKAKTMYFAVYLFGPHWVNLVPGEDCGPNCIKQLSSTGKIWEADSYSKEESTHIINNMKLKLEANPDLSIDDIEGAAEKIKPDYFFFKHGNKYTPVGTRDPNII